MRSLTSRLVLVAVLLVAVVAGGIALSTTLAMRAYLTGQLDDRVHDAARSLPRPDGDRGPNGGDGDGPPGGFGNQQPGLLIVFAESGIQPVVLGAGLDGTVALDDEQVASVLSVGDGPTTVDVPGLGSYRLERAGSGTTERVVGLPTEDLDDSVGQLITLVVILSVAGVALAAGAGFVVVRRQLRPLREVADTAHRVSELPLAEGDIDLGDRVPTHLTDERTEVGQVGSALNTLLDHVEDSLEARHRSETQVRQFVADASHELRTPLATITGYTELARRRPDEDNVRTALTKVEEESARMTSLVEDLLLLARLDAGRPLERAPVDLTHLLLEAVSDARVLAPDHRWRLELPEEPLEVVGDEQRLHQVVTNLLTNARKHTPAGTTVTVRGVAGGFDVHDDGPGFPPEFVAKAFERFARVDESRQRTGGAGLGLALVEAIVHSHGGTVSLASEPGGTTIGVRLR